MKLWTIEQLKTYIIASGGHVPEPYPGLKQRHYRLLLLGAARRLAAKKNSSDNS